MNLWITWGNQVPLCSSKWWHFCVSVEDEYTRQLEFPHPNGNIKISFGQGLWMRSWDWRGELSSEHVFMKLRKCFAEVRPVKNGLHFWSLDLALYLAQMWWWSCGQLCTATLLILTPNLHCTPTVLETVSGSVLLRNPLLRLIPGEHPSCLASQAALSQHICRQPDEPDEVCGVGVVFFFRFWVWWGFCLFLVGFFVCLFLFGFCCSVCFGFVFLCFC